MPVIKVWCLPEMGEQELNRLHQSIVAAAVSVEALDLKGEEDMTTLFPPDMMSYGLGTDVVVEVTGLTEKPERTDEVRNELARKLGLAVKELLPNASVECFVRSFDEAKGFWSSSDS